MLKSGADEFSCLEVRNNQFVMMFSKLEILIVSRVLERLWPTKLLYFLFHSIPNASCTQQ